MRRAKPPGPLSPQLLKHFAAVTVALTSLLALFASGEDWGAQAQVQAVTAKNRLVATEAEKLGTNKLAAKLHVTPEAQPATFGEDAGDFASSNSGGGGTVSASTGYRPTRISQTNMANARLPGSSSKAKSNPAGPVRPTQQQLDQIKAASQYRSSGGTSAD